MVKFFIWISSIFLLNSCRKVQFNEYGVMSRIKQNKIINLPDSIYKNLDTLALYKEFKYKSVGNFYKPKEDIYLRFFTNGKFISYSSQIQLSKEYFRPARGIQGEYFVKKNKLQCSFYNYPYGVSGIIFFKNDTLIIEAKNNIIYYYTKQKDIDPDWLNWKADW